MKKLIAFLALTVLALAVHAQGVVFFANHVLDPTPYVIDGLTGDRLTGTQYGAQLYYGVSATSLAAHTAAPNRFFAAGSSRAGTWSIATGASRTLTGAGGWGIPVWMQVRVWNVEQFPTYEAAVAGGGIYGNSTVFQYIEIFTSVGTPQDTYMIYHTSGVPLFESFATVPEPSVALLALGSGIFFWICRHRSRSK